MNKEQRAFREQRVRDLHKVADAWEGTDKDYAAQLHAEAAAMANDPDFANMDKQAERRHNIAVRITAESEKAGADALLIARAPPPTPEEITAQYWENARAERKRPEILEAIIAVRGSGPVKHPCTTAKAILPKVNAWLKLHEREPTTKKPVYTCLGKFPRIRKSSLL